MSAAIPVYPLTTFTEAAEKPAAFFFPGSNSAPNTGGILGSHGEEGILVALPGLALTPL